jgi:hypothetical protein
MKNINRKKSLILVVENKIFLLNYTFNENYYSKRFLISLKKIKP